MRDEVDDTDMSAAEFRAARDSGTPTQVVRSREEFDAHSRHGGAMFEVYEDRTGKFRFRLRASTGQVVATSEAYGTKAAARRGAVGPIGGVQRVDRGSRLLIPLCNKNDEIRSSGRPADRLRSTSKRTDLRDAPRSQLAPDRRTSASP